MLVFVASFVVIALAITLMAVGVMAGREPIKGSCGGLNKLGLREGDCPVCGGDPGKCESGQSTSVGEPLGYDAMRRKDDEKE